MTKFQISNLYDPIINILFNQIVSLGDINIIMFIVYTNNEMNIFIINYLFKI